MQSLILEIWFCLLIAFLLGLLFGWLLRASAAKRERAASEHKYKNEIIKSKEAGNENFKSLLKDLEALKARHEQKAKADNSPITLAPIEARAGISQIENIKQTSDIPTLDAKPAEPVEDATPSLILKEAPSAESIDDLKLISGVGPKLEQMLNNLGIYQLTQIANLSADDVEWISDNLEAFQDRIKTDDWVGQAQALLTKDT